MGAAQNYSGGAGRASPTADTSYGVRAVGVAEAAKVPVHSRRAASEPTRPADDIGRRPEVPAGVGPTVNMSCTAAKLESHISQVEPHTMGVVVF